MVNGPLILCHGLSAVVTAVICSSNKQTPALSQRDETAEGKDLAYARFKRSQEKENLRELR